MAFENIAQFTAEIKDFQPAVLEKQAVLMQQKIAMDILKGVVRLTPRDTGRAKGNWQTSINDYPLDSLWDKYASEDGEEIISAGNAIISNCKFGNTIFITNNLPYIVALESGHHSYAGAHMLTQTMERAARMFE